MILEAYKNKAEIVPYLDFELKLLVLELKPTNAAVSYDLSELIDDSIPIQEKSQPDFSYDKESADIVVVKAPRLCYTKAGKSLGIVKDTDGQYLSIGVPKKT